MQLNKQMQFFVPKHNRIPKLLVTIKDSDKITGSLYWCKNTVFKYVLATQMTILHIGATTPAGISLCQHAGMGREGLQYIHFLIRLLL